MLFCKFLDQALIGVEPHWQREATDARSHLDEVMRLGSVPSVGCRGWTATRDSSIVYIYSSFWQDAGKTTLA